jgi:hypothetical protein
MKFERHEDGQGFLSDDFGNAIQLSDDQIDGMRELSGQERLDYIIENLRDPLKSGQQETGGKKIRNPQLAKDPLAILEEWTATKGMAKTLSKINFDADEDEIDDDDDEYEEKEIADGDENDER